VKIVWSPRVVAEIGDHVAFIAQDSEKAAVEWADDLFRRVEALLEFPEIGRSSAKGGARGIREVIIDSDFIVTYKVRKREIAILAFIQTARKR
jgi:toxin ParE1/3/4